MKKLIGLYSNLDSKDFKTVGMTIHNFGFLFSISTDGSLWYHINDENTHYKLFGVELANMNGGHTYVLSFVFIWAKVSFVWLNP